MRFANVKQKLSYFKKRKSYRRFFIKKAVLKYFKKFTEKKENTFLRVSFLIKMHASASNFIKKTLAQVMFYEFWETFKSTCFREHLREAAFAKILAELPLKLFHEILDV